MTEASFMKHSCRLKTRVFELENVAYVRLGYQAHMKYRKLVLARFKAFTYLDYAQSSYFKSFTDFGKYLDEIQVVNVDEFIGFLVDHKIPLKKWKLPMIYDHYLKMLNKKEPAEEAVVRTLKVIESWSIQTGLAPTSFFLEVDVGYFLILLRSGRLSPWLVLNARSFSQLLTRMTTEEQEMVLQTVELAYWDLKFEANHNDTAIVKEVLRQYGI